MKKIWKKFKLFWKELGNILTNLLCPVLAVIAAGMELCQLPTKWIQGVKKAEYWCWKLCGTKENIDKIVDKIDEVVNTPEVE